MPSGLMTFDPGSPHGFCGRVSLQTLTEAVIPVPVYPPLSVPAFVRTCNRFEHAAVI